MREWLEAAEPSLGPDTPMLEGWHSAAAAAAFIGATTVEAWTGGVEGALVDARRAIELEVDPAQRGYALARVALGRVLLGAGRAEEAAAVLSEAWRLPLIRLTSPVLRMQTAGELVAALLRTESTNGRGGCAASSPPRPTSWKPPGVTPRRRH